MTVRVGLVDDHAIVREGVRSLLERSGLVKVVGEAASGYDCLTMVEECRPDVVVMDISMPGLNGIETTWKITEQWPGVKVVILSVHSSTEHVYRAFAAGALGYILKESIGRELLDAICGAHRNQRYLSEKIKDSDWGQFLPPAAVKSPLASLSQRERQVMQLVVDGYPSAEIATRLELSAKTVDTYRSRLMQKLGVGDITSLVKFAIQHGITTLDYTLSRHKV